MQFRLKRAYFWNLKLIIWNNSCLKSRWHLGQYVSIIIWSHEGIESSHHLHYSSRWSCHRIHLQDKSMKKNSVTVVIDSNSLPFQIVKSTSKLPVTLPFLLLLLLLPAPELVPHYIGCLVSTHATDLSSHLGQRHAFLGKPAHGFQWHRSQRQQLVTRRKQCKEDSHWDTPSCKPPQISWYNQSISDLVTTGMWVDTRAGCGWVVSVFCANDEWRHE